jgi:hypothetical protein
MEPGSMPHMEDESTAAARHGAMAFGSNRMGDIVLQSTTDPGTPLGCGKAKGC